MEAKTILSFKTCIKFNYFFKFLQAYLNLANISTFKKNLKNSKWPQYGRFFAQKFMIFCKKNHDFLVAEPLNEMF
jgi:hypothetical protein